MMHGDAEGNVNCNSTGYEISEGETLVSSLKTIFNI